MNYLPEFPRLNQHPLHRSTRNRKLLVEPLEDRTLPSTVPFLITPDHFYSLDGTLADDFGGPGLQGDTNNLGTDRFSFGNNSGLRLENALADPATYTILMNLQMDVNNNFFKKLIDFRDRTSDNGLYAVGTSLQLFPESGGPSVVPDLTDFQLLLSRDGANNEVSLYVNDQFQSTLTGSAVSASLPTNNVLTFFEDDTVTLNETATGSVDYIAVFDAVYTPADIFGAGNQAPEIDADQSDVTVSPGETALNTGTWSDPDGDSVTLNASVGDVQQFPDGTWEWSYLPSNSPGQSQEVTITATDGLLSSTVTFNLAVNQVPEVGIGDPLLPDLFYGLNGTLDEQNSGPALASGTGSLGPDGYSFGNNEGLQLSGALQDVSTYTVVMELELSSLSPTFKKLLDFREGSIDSGLYVVGSTLGLFPGSSGSGQISVGTRFQAAITRDGLSGETSVYLNGSLQRTYTGSGSADAVPTTNVLTFFEDDSVTNSETAQGFVDFIAIYDRPLQANELVDLVLPRPEEATGSTELTVNRGDVATNAGFWSDSPEDDVTLTASVGTVTQNDNGTWGWVYDTADAAGGTQTVVITVTDSHGATAETSFTLNLPDNPPEITDLSSDHSTIATASADGTVTVTGTFTDLDVNDTHTVTLDWGDGTVETLPAEAVTNMSFSASHEYDQGGVFQVRVTVTDAGGNEATESTKAVVQGIGLVDGRLFVIGSENRDIVQLERVWKNGKKVIRVVLKSHGDEITKTVKFVRPKKVDKIFIFTAAGNDKIKININVHKPVFLSGGPGKDVLILRICFLRFRFDI